MVTDNLNQENKKGTSRTKQLLLAGFSGLIILCMAVFILVSVFLEKKSNETINEIGLIYMSEMSRQLKEKFTAIIDLRLSQV